MSFALRVRQALVLGGVTLLHGLPVHAQQSTESVGFGRGYFEVGGQKFNLDDLNRSLTAAGYPELGSAYVTLGGGGLATRGRIVLGGEGHGILERREDTADGRRRIGLGGGLAFFRLGAVFGPADGVDVIPMLGVGGGGMSLTIEERSSPTFADVLAHPGRSSRMVTGMFALDASLAVHYRPSGDGKPGGPMIGIHAGYTFAPNAGSWRLEAIDDVGGGPEAKIQGAYLRLSIGGWGGRRR